MSVHEYIEYSIVISGVSMAAEIVEKVEQYLDSEGVEDYRVYDDAITVCKIDSKATALRLDSELKKIIKGS